MKTQKIKIVLSILLSLTLLIIISSCGDKSDSAEERGQQLQEKEKELIESGKHGVEDLAGKINLLTIADIEKVSGVSGIKLVDKGSLPGAGGSLNFALNDKMYAMFVIADMNVYDQWKTGEKYVHEKLSGIGDEAFSAPEGPVQFIVFFRDGSNVASVSSFVNFDTGDPYLNLKQLSDLARIVAARM
ncbi:MAG TPA: hypothetical protein VLH59_11150 [Ignavibacteriaceae bacterium]|nr:hypothetical protein [Ignavibacteriaceae bacterium]